jgi:quinol-cytochrome oxidoreductase complex cytochrome b subunit
MENTPVKIPRDRLLFRELFTALAAIILLGWLALLAPAPLSAPGGAGAPTETAVQAPWIFVGLQALLAWLPPLWGGVALPLAGLVFLALLPWEKKGPLSSRTSAILFALLIITSMALTLYGCLK